MENFIIHKIVSVEIDTDFQKLMEDYKHVEKENPDLSEEILLEQMKVEIVVDILKKATLEQLEKFKKSL